MENFFFIPDRNRIVPFVLLRRPDSLSFSLSPLSLPQLHDFSVRCLCIRFGEDKQEQHEEEEAEYGGQHSQPYILNTRNVFCFAQKNTAVRVKF
jgi:hypothetical protein